MSDQIIGMHDWLATPPGQYLLAWERAQMALTVANLFGYHALQLGLPELDALEANRMPHRWLATQSEAEVALSPRVAFATHFFALPFPANSLDLVVLPHTLELTADPHGALREVARVLMPEGRVVICGLNPLSLWGFRQRRARWLNRLGGHSLFLPNEGEFIGYLRLRDWLRLLDLEIEDGHFGCYRPAFSSQAMLHRFNWMDKAGARWWPILGSAYFLVAIKRVRSMMPINPIRKPALRLPVAPVPVANSAGKIRARDQKDA
ncbi:class I SAM-dependent methyltransferase [Rhodoferax antarcticus]|uniref:Methyltransferase domain protein n=1 Tax=Rhodoferax antarcticus ANT.BR TaxID=1111071 RepID=A0A1Q8YEF2_9BURK|nr:methyltransferase domain-containing protein [Rhodoferax antarcticus]MCW2313506.1 SAM-dependent methyltransferase [Rhodoferax antarcticus]OLP06413.1 methyltransferase domain protein [Rhodoferax antarcticus ANT.BR]